MNADLHSHSTASDGLLTPANLVRRAKHNGVELLALTDRIVARLYGAVLSDDEAGELVGLVRDMRKHMS